MCDSEVRVVKLMNGKVPVKDEATGEMIKRRRVNERVGLEIVQYVF